MCHSKQPQAQAGSATLRNRAIPAECETAPTPWRGEGWLKSDALGRCLATPRSIRDMSPNLAFKSVNSTDAEANLPCYLADADAFCQLPARALELVGFGAGAT
jgi:hypothetical protein